MKKILVVIDMQKDFIDGSLGTPEAQAIVKKVKAKIDAAVEQNREVIFTRDTHNANYLETQEGKQLPVVHCVQGTEGWAIEPSLTLSGARVFDKDTFGCLELAHYLIAVPCDEVELVGLCTDICIISNALLLKAYLPELTIIVDSSCCAGVTPVSHKNALEAMKMCQIQIV